MSVTRFVSSALLVLAFLCVIFIGFCTCHSLDNADLRCGTACSGEGCFRSPRDVSEEWHRLADATAQLSQDNRHLLNFRSAHLRTSTLKNRYSDILPFEYTRVRLNALREDGSDYINANWIAGKEFIATQAPLPATITQFWQMVWEQDSSVIVMLTKFMEKGITKAHPYWPTRRDQREQHGFLTVQMIEESFAENVHTHTSLLRVCDASRCRDVHHLHYVGWPDFGVPAAADDVIALIEKCRALQEKTIPRAPVIVHCSAGVGRAGTFIAASKVLGEIGSGTSQSRIYDLVLEMRQARSNMVQREEQYAFIYELVAEHQRRLQ